MRVFLYRLFKSMICVLLHRHRQTRLQAAVKGIYGIKQPVPFDMYLQRAGMKSALYDSMPRQAYEFKISCSKLPRRAQVRHAPA